MNMSGIAELNSPQPESSDKRTRSSTYLIAALCSVLVPGTGHFVLGRYAAGAIWLALAIALYAAQVIFRLATNLELLGAVTIVGVIICCAAAVDCSLRHSP